MTTRAMVDGEALDYLLDLPEGIYVDYVERVPQDTADRPPKWRLTLRASETATITLPDGPVNLEYRQEPGAAPSLVAIEPVSTPSV